MIKSKAPTLEEYTAAVYGRGKKPKYDLGKVQVYLTKREVGWGKHTVTHHRLEVIGECLNELEIRNYVYLTVLEALKKDQRLLVR